MSKGSYELHEALREEARNLGADFTCEASEFLEPWTYLSAWAERPSHINLTMPREEEPSLNEREFLCQALRENVRLDGRAFDAFRAIDLSFGDEYGVADVRIGKTRYVSILEYFGAMSDDSIESWRAFQPQ